MTEIQSKIATKDKDNFQSAMTSLRIEQSEKILENLVGIMNEIHGVNYSYRFWKIVLSSYVSSLITRKHILELEEINTQPLLEPINSLNMPTLKQRIITRIPGILKHVKTFRNKERINEVLMKYNTISIDLPEIDAVRNDTGQPLPLYHPIFPGNGDMKKRQKTNQIADSYENLFFKNMIRQLPKIYVEYFDSLFEGIPLIEPAEKTFHVHGLLQFYTSLIIAKYIEHGAKLICYQHGAFYGEIIGHTAHFNESSLADEFRTWGWKIMANDVPWKAYRLEKFKLEYDKFLESKMYDFLLCYPIIHHKNIKHYQQITDFLLTRIDAQRYFKILARPRPRHKLFSQAKSLKFIKDKRVKIDSGLTNMAGVINNCKLIIQFKVPATNFLECLYVNHPTMGLLDNNHPTDAVKPYYEFLVQKGVLHTNINSLVDHLNTINIDEWWKSIIEEPMYIQFKNEFLKQV